MPKKLLIGVLLLVTILFTNSCQTIHNVVNNVSSSNIATVAGMTVEILGGLDVYLKPVSAKANVQYTIDLYEKGNLRSSKIAIWTQPQINVKDILTVPFGLTHDEYEAYSVASLSDNNWWKSTFSVKVYEPTLSTTSYTTESTFINPNKQASLTIKYPNGGEIWHVGETVNITWTSANLTKDAKIQIYVSNDSGVKTLLAITHDAPNIGSYKWTVTSSWVKLPNYELSSGVNASYIGNHTRIEVSCSNFAPPAISASDFTISQ